MVTRKSTVSLSVEHLESRLNPAPLLAVTAAQLAAIHDAAGTDGEADIGRVVNLPAKGQNAVILLRAIDTGFATDQLAIIRDGVLADSHSYGTLAPDLYASAFAQAEGLPLFEPTLTQADDGKLPCDPALLESLDGLEPGSAFTDAQLADYLDVLPATLTAPGQPLQLAVATEGGWRVHTLTLTTEYGESAWTLTGGVFASSLTPGIWQLATTE